MRLLSALLLLLFLSVLAVFAYENRGLVDIRFLRTTIAFPLAAVAAIAYVLGMFTGWTVLGVFRRSLRRVQEPAH